jgi:hypothetical protein
MGQDKASADTGGAEDARHNRLVVSRIPVAALAIDGASN